MIYQNRSIKITNGIRGHCLVRNYLIIDALQLIYASINWTIGWDNDLSTVAITWTVDFFHSPFALRQRQAFACR